MNMSKRTTFTTISPLPVGVTREVVIEFLHNHQEMIDLNPLVKERHCINPPPHATPEEFHCIWYSLTDRISYLPGGLVSGDVTYTCAFHDLPNGVQTHCYAPAGLNIRDKWTLNGSLPGEPIEPVELGTGAPITGLYIREDVDMKCNVVMASFVKKTLKKSHAALIERLKVKAQIATAAETNARLARSLAPSSSSNSTRSDLGSRPWTPSSSISSSSLSTRTSMSQPRSNSSTPPQMPSPYSSPPQSARLSGSPNPYPQSTWAISPIPGSQSYTPYQARKHPPPNQFQDHPRYNPVASPPQYQQHSPPTYGRDSPPQQQTPPRPEPRHQYLAVAAAAQQQQQKQQQQTDLVPAPLRVRQGSAGSTTGSAPVGSMAQPPPPPGPVYRDASGRVTWAAVSKLRSGGSVRYRVSHPDYPQMNPYADEEGQGEEAPPPTHQKTRVRGDWTTTTPRIGCGAVRVGMAVRAAAELKGPLVAELEG